MMRSSLLLVAVMLGALPCGCVTRRYYITSDPPGAIVYQDGQPIGPTPVERPFVYYGKYRFRLVKDGYAPLDVEPEFCPPWYQWVGIDFFTENFVPYTFRDIQCLHYQLQPLEMVRPDDVRARAEQLRQRGQQIVTPPGTETAPRIRPGPAAQPAPPSLPAPTPAPTSPFPAPTPADGGPVTARPASTGASQEAPSASGVQGFPVSRPGGPSRESP